MQSLILALVLVTTLAIFAWMEWRSPSRAPTIRVLLLGIATLALSGLLALAGLPLATCALPH